MHKVCVLGDGSFGTAIANLLADNGCSVKIWCYNSEIAKSINEKNLNKIYFPEFNLNKNISATNDLNEIKNNKIIFVAIPVKFLRNVLNSAKEYISKDQIWVLLSKGLEQKTFYFPGQIIDDVFQFNVKKVIIAGPSFAKDIINKSFTAVNYFTKDNVAGQNILDIMQNDYFKLKFCDDEIGIQAWPAFKNVIAILIGKAKGLNLSDNMIAFLFTKAMNEFSKLIVTLGGKKETLNDLCAIGDLVLTVFGKHSKNLQLGKELAKHDLNELLKLYKTQPEGINTLESLNALINSKKIESKFIQKIYNVVFLNDRFEELLSI